MNSIKSQGVSRLLNTALIVLLFYSFSACYSALAQVTPVPTIWSAANGNWGTAATWNTGLIPNATDNVEIRHTVTADVDANVNSISLNNSFAATRLRVVLNTIIRLA